MNNKFETIVSGITKKNSSGEDRQNILEKYVKENYDFNTFDRDDSEYWSPQEIKDFDFRVYQYELYEENTIELIPEPENPYDKNAIKVVHKEMGDIGYIPKKDNKNLAKFIEDCHGDVNLSIELEGGRYKYYNGEMITTGSKLYGLRITVKPKQSEQNNSKEEPIQSDDLQSNVSGQTNITSNKDDQQTIKRNNKHIKYFILCAILAIISIKLGNILGFIIFLLMSLCFLIK